MASKIMLPFGQIQPGTFDAAFQRPKSQATGLPMGVEQLAKDPAGAPLRGTGLAPGVEQQARTKLAAKLDQGPQRPMIVNGGMMFGAPAAAPAPAAPAASPALPFGRASAPVVASAPAPANSLSRGAGPRGLGGVAPVRVGRSNYDPQRMAERMVRRKNPLGAQFLFGQAAQQQQQGFAREMFGAQQQAEAGRDARNFDQGVQMFGMQQQAEAGRDARNFDQGVQMFGMQQQAADQRYDRERKDQLTDEQKKQGFTVQALDPNDPTKGTAILRADGTLFNVLPAQKPVSPGLTADDINAARMMGGDVNIQQGNTQIRLPGMAPAKPTRLTPIPGAPSMIQGQPATPDRVFDPYNGAFYEAGKVPGRGAATTPASPTPAPKAAATPDPKERMNALRKRLGLAEL